MSGMGGPFVRLGRFGAPTGVNPLRAATLACSAWALGVLVLTAIGVTLEARESEWQGLAAPIRLVPALACAAASYALRFLRWHLLARRVAPGLGPGESFTIGTIGFALTVTPGRAGEALKLLLLRQRVGTPVATSAPVLLLEKVSEGLGFAVLALVAAPFLPWSQPAWSGANAVLVGAALVTLALAVALRRQVFALVPRLPLIGRLLARPGLAQLWANLARGGDRVLGWHGLLLALGLSLLARVCDGLAIFWVAWLFGIELSPAAAWFMLGSVGLVGGLSMLPGGAGVVEAGLIGLLVVFGGSPAQAAAAALTSRVLIFWLWVALGLGLAFHYCASHPDRATALGEGGSG